MTKTGKLSYFFGDGAFYRHALGVAVPIMLQNAITTFVSLLDNIMVGAIGTEQMSAVAIVNKLILIFNLLLFGGCAGVGIFCAQFYGKGDHEGIKRCFRLKVATNLIILIIAELLFGLCKEPLISLYLHESVEGGDLAATLEYAKQYIGIILIGLIPQSITECYASTMRETEHTALPMVSGIAAVLTNLFFNWVLIFGNLGAPALGVKGAAIATVISKYVELAIIASCVHARKAYTFLHGVYRDLSIPASFVKTVLPRSIPLLCNEGLWATGIAALASCYSTRGLYAVAGFNISSTVGDLFNVASLALGNAIAIIVGKQLGEGNAEKARQTDARLITFSLLISIGLSVMLFFCAPLFPMLYKGAEPAAKDIATSLLRIYALYLIINTFTCACYFTLRSGGKTIITFIFDSAYVMFVSFPFTLLLAKATTLDIVPLYAFSLSIDFIKCVLGFYFVKKGTWIHNIVDDL